MWVSIAAGLAVVLGFVATAIAKIGEFPGLPGRVAAIEHAQSEMNRRVDGIASDIKVLSRDREEDSRRTSQNFHDLTKTLSEMSGVLADVRSQGIGAQKDIAAAKEKAANAAVIADDAARSSMELRAKWDAEHQTKKDK